MRAGRLLRALALAAAAPLAHAAGVQPVAVPADAQGPALRGVVWSPCEAPAGPLALGPLRVAGTRGCPIAGTGPLPLVLLSHGSGGSALGHHDTAAALADAGFVVAAVHHPGDHAGDRSRQGTLAAFASRPADIARLLDHLLQAWPERARIDPARIGFFGFSRGGVTGLVLLGGVPDFARLRSTCTAGSAVSLCAEIARPAAAWPPLPPADPRIRAAVIVDPLDLFDAAGLRAVAAPVQLWASALGGEGVTPDGTRALRQALPRPPEWHAVPGAGHFAFLPPCPPALAQEAPAACADAPGFDRAAFHTEFSAAVRGCLQQQLGAR